ncbi:hypothetical protein ABKP09_19990 [Peribacillus frigoritolerans]|uniref:hypothetical protein n=1 Tax=Peribacillus frigoritolerans TaxID=450367 RepID=UPI0032B36F18
MTTTTEKMLKGECINPGAVDVLTEGTSYYLFPAGPSYFYVSKFPNKNSHRGCFERKLFTNIREVNPSPEVKATIIEETPQEEAFEQLSLF